MVVVVGAIFLLAILIPGSLLLIILLTMKEETVNKLKIPESIKRGILAMQRDYIKSTPWHREEEEKRKRIEEAERKAIVYVRSGSS